MKGVLSHTREDTLSWSVLVCIVSIYIYMNCIWLHACLALKRKEKKNSNHALKPITCCTFDVIFYLSKNYLTRSPSWDEHISFSRVSWPTSRHQVNTLFQFQHSNRDRLTYGGLLKWIRSQIHPPRVLSSCWRFTFNCWVSCTSQSSHPQQSCRCFDGQQTPKTIRETKTVTSSSVNMPCLFSDSLSRNNRPDYQHMLSSIGVTFLFNSWLLPLTVETMSAD